MNIKMEELIRKFNVDASGFTENETTQYEEALSEFFSENRNNIFIIRGSSYISVLTKNKNLISKFHELKFFWNGEDILDECDSEHLMKLPGNIHEYEGYITEMGHKDGKLLSVIANNLNLKIIE